MENEVDTINLPRNEDLLAWLAWLVPVIFLLLWDVGKAWKRWAPWIPGQTLVLSPFIIRLLSYIDYSHISVYSGSRYQTVKVEAILVKNQKVIDSGRLMMCVLIAYLIPGMARSSSITDWSNLAALALSITFHVVNEFRSDWKVEKRNESLSALAPSSEGLDRINSYLNDYIFAIILISAIIYLLLLLIHAVMIGETIRRSISQNVPSAISCCTPDDEPRCSDIKDHVLKCWIVVRLCQPDYIFSRSSLCSTLWPTVTSCFGVYIINWIYIYNESLNSVETLVKLVIAGQIVLIGIGWIVLLVRWVTSDRQGNISGEYYIYGMSFQDWKSELQVRFIGLFVWDKRIQEKINRDINKKIRDIQASLWDLWHWVQTPFPIFSMQNPLRWLTSTERWSDIKTRVINYVSIVVVDPDQFSKYKETLEMLLIPEESASSLWKANQWGFSKVERYMDQGHGVGMRSPSELISLLRLKTGTVEHDLLEANENSWKRTAVSLIHLMIFFYGPNDDSTVIEKAMQCYIQGWEYMDFVDGLNEKVKSLGQQADGEFYWLQHSWNKRLSQPGMLREIRQPIRELSKLQSSWDGREVAERELRKLQNSWDTREVAKYCLLQTRSFLTPWSFDIPPPINKIGSLQGLLADVYFFYMTEGVNEAVLQECLKVAEEGTEKEILDVAFLAAKAQGVLDEVREENNRRNPVENPHNTGQASTSSTIPTEIEQVGEANDREDPVEAPHNTDQASTSSTIRTEIELVGEGNDQAEATTKLIRDQFAHAVNTILTKLKLQWWSKETTQTQIELKVKGNDATDNAINNV